MNKELIEKYFKNNCSEDELITVLAWFEKSAETADGKSFLYNTWEEMAGDDEKQTSNLDIILHRIHHQVNLKKTEELLNEPPQEDNNSSKREYFIKIFTRIAAILLIPVLVYGVYISNKYDTVKQQQALIIPAYYEITSSFDALTKVALPDGTKVWLNYGSTLTYPASFKGDTRKVELKGEGFFEVAHNTSIPFIVKAGDLEVVARGTAFNIAAYADDDRIETSLINGKVELSRVKPDGEIVSLKNMKPNDLIIYNKANHETESFVIEDDRNYSWKEGKLKLIQEPLVETIKLLGRRYNTDFKIKDNKLLELTFSATFVNESLPEVMKLLSIATPVNYTITEPKKLADGTFTKRKVVLSSRNK
jgi:ferric-dicitrate binding protein FerR (iron transport regulator)